jgi:hypothetical protein
LLRQHRCRHRGLLDHPAVNHDPLRSLDVLSARGERAHPRFLRSFPSSRSSYPRHRSSSTGVSPPTALPPAPCSSARLVVSFASPLLRFSMIYNTLNLLLLLGFCLFCSIPSSSLISWDL